MGKYIALVFCGLGLLCSGCASYKATSLTSLSPEYVQESAEVPGIVIGCKSFSSKECASYLDRNVLKKGYQPVELTFHNQTDQSYVFSSHLMSLPCVPSEEVAKTVRTSTVGRIAGYTAGSLLFTPLIIPAVVDGICSYKSNKRLDKDFKDKSEGYFIIAPHSYRMTLVFIPEKDFIPNFQITLLEQGTQVSKTVNVIAR